MTQGKAIKQEFLPGDYVRVKDDTPVAWGNRDVSGFRGIVRSTAGGIALLDLDRGQGAQVAVSPLECLEPALPDYPEVFPVGCRLKSKATGREGWLIGVARSGELTTQSDEDIPMPFYGTEVDHVMRLDPDPMAHISRVWEAMLARREAEAEGVEQDASPDVLDYASMSVSELIGEAHKNARVRGFYDDYEAMKELVGSEYQDALRDMVVAQRLALIATEVGEFDVANEKREELEELADVCIRVFDLVGFFEDDLFDCELLKDSPVGVSFYGKSNLLASLYSSISSATTGHQISSDDALFCSLGVVVDAASDYARETYEDDSLRRAIGQKMEKNRGREYKHGKRY